MSKFSQALAQYIDVMANPRASVTDEHTAAENVCAAIETQSQAQIAFDSMDDASRFIGNYVVDNSDDMATLPHESEGCAYMVLSDDSAIWAEWDSYGFWYVDFVSRAKAYREMEARAIEFDCEDDDSEFGPDHDETHWAQ